MNVRHQAHSLLAAVQTALRSGEWIPPEDSLVKYAVPALEQTLAGVATCDIVQYHFDRLAELVGQAVTSGEWMPGDWASEWQGWYMGDLLLERMPPMPAGDRIVIDCLAA